MFTSQIRATRRRLLTAIFAAGAVVGGVAAAAAQQPYRIGVIGVWTGPGSVSNVYGKYAVELMADAINAGTLPAPYDRVKGIAGRPVELIFVDESGGAAKQVSEFRALVERQNADMVMGFGLAPTCIAIAPVAEELKALTVMSTCGTPRIFEERDYRYSFRTASHSTMDGVALARYAVQRWPEAATVGHINPNMAFGQDSWRDFRLAMKALKPQAQFTTELWPTMGSAQFSSEISALASQTPALTHSALFGADLEAFIAQMSRRDIHEKTKFLASSLDLSINRLGDRIPDGVVFGARGPYSVFAPDTALNRWFVQAFTQRFKEKPVFTAYQYAQSLFGLIAAVEKARAANGGAAPDKEQVINAFEKLEFESFGGAVRMSLGKGHQAITAMAVGEYVFDKAKNAPSVRNVVTFAAECVNPPDGVASVTWLETGMPGAKCN